jgi:hypothetical protein
MFLFQTSRILTEYFFLIKLLVKLLLVASVPVFIYAWLSFRVGMQAGAREPAYRINYVGYVARLHLYFCAKTITKSCKRPF